MLIPTLELTSTDEPDSGADVLAVPMAPDGDQAVLVRPDLTARLGLDLPAHLANSTANGPAKGKVGEIITVPRLGSADVLIVGIGDRSAHAFRRAGAALARRVKGRNRLSAAVAVAADANGLRAFIEGLSLAAYAFHRKSTPPTTAPFAAARILVDEPSTRSAAFERAAATVRAVGLARDLANTPSNEKDPAWLAAQARELAAAADLDVRIWDEVALAAEGFGGLVAVGSGSVRPPRLISLSYIPTDPAPHLPHVVLVGKGITFDSGGLSIKPREAMVPMKADMAGGAAVISVLATMRDLGVRARVTGLVAAAENLPSGSAYRPSDVIKQYGGTTVEVLNTDAEGRLVLADALAYADRELDPDVIVDLATLTGAATLGLSRKVAALYATDDDLAAALIMAGDAGGEALWRMPLADVYRSALDSDIADLCHVTRDRRVGGGSITAALFLREFVGERRWAHLDIAGPGKIDADDHELTKGGTGFGVRTLLRWLESL